MHVSEGTVAEEMALVGHTHLKLSKTNLKLTEKLPTPTHYISGIQNSIQWGKKEFFFPEEKNAYNVRTEKWDTNTKFLNFY